MSYEYGEPLKVADFSGGKTDDYIEGATNQGQEFDNLQIQKNAKLKSRPGTNFYISAAQAQLPIGNSRVYALVKHVVNKNLLAIAGERINSSASGSWAELVGPVDSNHALGTSTSSNFASWSDYKGHTFIVNDSFCDPVKVYRDQNGTYQVRTAGLPRLDMEGAIDLANALKTAYNLHRQDAAQHTVAPDTVNAVTATTAYDEATLITLTNQLVAKYVAHNADAELASGRAYHPGQNSPTHVLADTTTATTIDSCITLLDDLKTKFNAHDNDAASHGVAGSHQVSAQRIPQITSAGGTASFLYRLLFYYAYYIDDVLWEDFGPTFEVAYASASTGTKSISSIPAMANGTTRCYDTANIKVKIYRSIDSGTSFFYVGQVTNGTTTFSDTMSDTTLQDQPPLYTTGGVLDNDPPPKAKYFTAVNNVGVYANLKIGSQNYPNSFATSIPGDVDSVPGSFQDEVELPITGVSSIGIYPIIFCRNRFYRLEGGVDEQGRGTILQREVSRVKGCISNNGIVRVPNGLLFPGEDGFYFTDGYTVAPISVHLINTYKTLVSSATKETRIYGEYDSQQNRVKWTANDDSSISENNCIFELDLNFELTPRSVFVTAHGQGTSFRPTSLAFYNNTMVMGHLNGYVLKFDENSGTDLKVNSAVSASLWTTYAIIFNYKSCAYNFGTNDNFKYVPLMTLESRNDVNATIQVNSNNNNSGMFAPLKEIRSRSLITWGDAAITWNPSSPNYPWNVASIITAKRRFPAGGMRCLLKQIQLTNANTIIYNSDVYGTASINSTLKTVTISGTFPTDIVDYYISFEDTDYESKFLITSRTSGTVLVYSDPLNAVPTSVGTKWQISGYKKGELLYLISYGIRFAMIGQIQTTWKGETGGNA